MASYITDSISRKRQIKKLKVERRSVIFGVEVTWCNGKEVSSGSIDSFLGSVEEGDWYTTDLHLHISSIDAYLSANGYVVRHLEAGMTPIAIIAYAESDLPVSEMKPEFRIINASYLLAGKTLDAWAGITGASSADQSSRILEIMQSLDNTMLGSFGCPLSITIPATALEAWKRHIPKGEKYSRQHDDVESLARAAFFGGWNYLRDTSHHGGGVYFDANSMYAHVMRSYGVPAGRAIVASDYNAGDIGVYSVRVSGLYAGMLNPVSVRSGWEVIHPICEDEHDSFLAEMTSVDIELCTRLGIKIEFISGFSFDSMQHPFTEFIDRCEELRGKSASGTPVNALAKILQASLFGKLGASSENSEVLLTSRDLTEDGFIRVDGVCTIDNPDDTLSSIPRWIRKTQNTSGSIQPVWAAFITAHARAYLFDALLTAGAENLLYAATDSLILTPEGASRLLESGFCTNQTDYGQFKIVHRFIRFRSFAQNRYAGEGYDPDGVSYFFGASSGIPSHPDTDYNALYESWLSPDIITDQQALDVGSRVFTLPPEVVARNARLQARLAKQAETRATQTRSEMFGADPNRKIDKW